MAGKAEYKNKWQSENRDRIVLVVLKGEKEKIRVHAQEQGESINGFIKRAIQETMDSDSRRKV